MIVGTVRHLSSIGREDPGRLTEVERREGAQRSPHDRGTAEKSQRAAEKTTQKKQGIRFISTPSGRARTTNVIYQAEAPEESSIRPSNIRTASTSKCTGPAGARQRISSNKPACPLPPNTDDKIIEVWVNRATRIRIGVHGPAGAVNTEGRAARFCYLHRECVVAPAATQDNVGDGGSPQGFRPSEGEGSGPEVARPERKKKAEAEALCDQESIIGEEEGGGGGGGGGGKEGATREEEAILRRA
ncbi:hypothetical protein P167DRAFT_582523 [Morchella conica CCBAS932]|uniref:Uncharacterized protein n=1 Tax=Morchella conica CCBAS932 TaxID=1392247 RepID=A0A3N4KZW4_9PEZI|nr:hypothetical protein P167DRAFT_582523 [Morchella conica CCBAS932]